MCAFCAFLHSSGHTLQQWLRPLLGHWQTAHRSCRRDFLICPCDRWFTLTCSQSSSQTSSSCQSASPLAPSWKHLPELKSNVPSDSSLQPTLGQRFFSVPPACKRNAVEWISPHRNFSLLQLEASISCHKQSLWGGNSEDPLNSFIRTQKCFLPCCSLLRHGN